MKRGLLLFALAAILLGTSAVAREKEVLSPNPDFKPTPVDLPATGVRSYFVEESFEVSVPPAGWTTQTSGETYTWVRASGAANSGVYCAFVQYGPSGAWQDEWLVAPAVDTRGLTGLRIRWAEFDYQGYWGNYGLRHSVMVSTTVPDDPAAFTAAQVFTPANHTIEDDAWQLVYVDLNAYIGYETVYVALRYEGEYADSWVIDDVLIYQPLAHDVKPDKITPSDISVFAGGHIPCEVSVINMGGNAESFDVRLEASLDGVPCYDEIAAVTGLAAGDTTVVAFPAFTTELGDYTLTATTLLTGDEYAGNDVAAGLISCVDQVRRPFGILYTNWGCGFCPPATQAADAWYSLQGDAATLLRVHPYFPSVTDPFYLANTTENTFLLNLPPAAVSGTPTLYLDNLVDTWEGVYENLSWSERVEQAYVDRAAEPTRLSLEISYDADLEQAHVDVDVVYALHPGTTWLLYVAVTEDNLETPTAPNGETHNEEVFRKLYPGVSGTEIARDIGQYTYDVDLPLDPSWVFENLHAVAWVMAAPDGEVQNSAVVKLDDGYVAGLRPADPDPGHRAARQLSQPVQPVDPGVVQRGPDPVRPCLGLRHDRQLRDRPDRPDLRGPASTRCSGTARIRPVATWRPGPIWCTCGARTASSPGRWFSSADRGFFRNRPRGLCSGADFVEYPSIKIAVILDITRSHV